MITSLLPPSTQRSQRRIAENLFSGFTLIELIMVILVLGVLAMVAAPRFTGHSMELSGAAKKLAMDIRYCQELNMIRQGEEDNGGNSIHWQLEFAADHYCIWLDKDGDGVIDPKEYAVDPVGNVDYKVRLDDLHLDSITLDPAVSSIDFSGQGKPRYTGSDGDYDGIKFTLAKGSEQITLKMESITGNVF